MVFDLITKQKVSSLCTIGVPHVHLAILRLNMSLKVALYSRGFSDVNKLLISAVNIASKIVQKFAFRGIPRSKDQKSAKFILKPRFSA